MEGCEGEGVSGGGGVKLQRFQTDATVSLSPPSPSPPHLQFASLNSRAAQSVGTICHVWQEPNAAGQEVAAVITGIHR